MKTKELLHEARNGAILRPTLNNLPAATRAQVVAILALILGQHHLGPLFVIGQIALWVATLTALVSAVDYYRRYNHVLGAS